MKFTVLKAGLLAATLTFVLTACGGVGSTNNPTPNTTDPSETTFAAGNATTAATGITQWHKSINKATTQAFIEGRDQAGVVVATLSTEQNLKTTAVEITGAFPIKVVSTSDSATNNLEAVMENPVFVGYRRDFDKLSGGSQASQTRRISRALTAEQRTLVRTNLRCMQVLAKDAYLPMSTVPNTSCEDYVLGRELSTDVMKIWALPSIEQRNYYIGFAGTRPNNPGDGWRDIQSALFLASSRQSVLTFFANPPGAILSGFWDRWANQINEKGIRGKLNQWATETAIGQTINPDLNLNINLVGHSLGAAAATIGALDISGWRNFERQPGGFNPVNNISVTAYVFNPPRTGNFDYALAYARTIADPLKGLKIYEFTVTNDPVQSSNFIRYHPFWNPNVTNATTNGSDQPAASLAMGYCPQYNVYRVPIGNNPLEIAVNALVNHNLTLWEGNILRMPDSHVDCMLGETAPPPPPPALKPVVRYIRGQYDSNTNGNINRWFVEVRQEIPQVRNAAGQATNDPNADWKVEYNVFYRGSTNNGFYTNSIGRTGGNFTINFEDGSRFGKSEDIGIQDQQWHELTGLRSYRNLIKNDFEYILDVNGARDLTIRGILGTTTSLTGRTP
jgi:Lipase (class 3)